MVESREATADGTPGNQTVDGVHRTEAAGKYWSNAIIDQLLPGVVNEKHVGWRDDISKFISHFYLSFSLSI